MEKARNLRAGWYSALLSTAFFLSGAAALIFETVWFRQAGLVVGNTVWASSIVLASFMFGLALGNGLAARLGGIPHRPLLSYAALEIIIGVAGLGLVLLFPVITPAAVPLWRSVLSDPWLLNAVRLALAFALLIVPTTAMGATLPLLVRALGGVDPDFGCNLGWLYGWNTLGAVLGAIGSEMLLIPRLGIRSTGATAALFDLLAAASAIWMNRRSVFSFATPSFADQAGERLSRRAWLLLLATGLSGAILLALEVIWVRFSLLFTATSSLSFAVMLAVVLLGIGLGGLVASGWLKRQEDAHAWLPALALFAALAVEVTYMRYGDNLRAYGTLFRTPDQLFLASLRLMFPVSFASGVLFTLIGRALKSEIAKEARAAGLLILANTLGASLGSLLAGFLLLPRMGMERSFFCLTLGYGVVALLLILPSGASSSSRFRLWMNRGSVVSFAVFAALFPFGLLRNHYLRLSCQRYIQDGSRVIAVREGLTETIVMLERDLWGQPVYYRLITNAHSMSGSLPIAKRYMKSFVYLPMALRPDARRALLVSYGLGVTAEALVDTPGLDSIDVVDISRDILEMSRMAFPPPRRPPLDDARVRVHLEDGRFFLLTSTDRYDLITGEPPPLKNAGITALYSKEYFALLKERLTEGGVVSYWLPVWQVELNEARTVVAAFCAVFEDCSLWSGAGLDWILLGTRGLSKPVLEADFTRQWRDPAITSSLIEIGLERPEQLGALFISDSIALHRFVGGVPPLDDDHPGRLSPRLLGGNQVLIAREFAAYQAAQDTRQRFEDSPFIKRVWPEALRQRSLQFFESEEVVNRVLSRAYVADSGGLSEAQRILTQTGLRAPALWIFGSDQIRQRIAEKAAQDSSGGPELRQYLGIEMMARRQYLDAEQHFHAAQNGSTDGEPFALWRAFALCLAGQPDRAAALVPEAGKPIPRRLRESWDWLARSYGLSAPAWPPSPSGP